MEWTRAEKVAQLRVKCFLNAYIFSGFFFISILLIKLYTLTGTKIVYEYMQLVQYLSQMQNEFNISV